MGARAVISEPHDLLFAAGDLDTVEISLFL
jgi:hypothetical protein